MSFVRVLRVSASVAVDSERKFHLDIMCQHVHGVGETGQLANLFFDLVDIVALV